MKRRRNKDRGGGGNSKKRQKKDPEVSATKTTSEPVPSTSTKVPVVPVLDVEPKIDPDGRLYNVEHPMLNPLVLSNVFKLMNPTIEQYKKIRLVCKCWLDVTFDEWRQKAPVRITEEKEVFVDKSPGGISAGEFLKRFEDPDDPYQLASAPFSTYIFTDLTINMSLADQEGSACCRFWDKVGPCFENLHLFKCAFPLHQYMAFEQLLLEKVPNLRKLSMTDCQKVRIPAATSSSIFANREAIIERVKKMKEKQLSVHTNLKSLTICGEMPVKLKRLISKVPNIEELRIRRIRDDMDALESHFSEDDDGELLDVLVMIRNQRIQSNHTKYPLKSLDLMYSRILYNPVSFPRLLDNVKFPLTTLSVEINPQQSANRQQLKPLMEIHAGTLKNLTVFCPPFHHTRYHDTFPFAVNMEQLEHLVILGNVTRDLKFLKFMPNLKRVEIRPRCEPISKVILSLKNGTLENTRYSPYLLPCADDIVERTFENGEADVFPSTSLQSLEIDYEFKTESLRRLKELMPNLSSLKSIFNRQTLPIVCELWPDINFIKAGYGSNIDDSSITGWKYQQGERTTTTGKHCLAKLTDLRGFQLETLCGQAHLTSLSLPDGFLTMPRLVQVDITVSPKFSDEAINQLKRHVPVCTILQTSVRKGKFCSSKTNECCQRKMYLESLENDRLEYNRRQQVQQRMPRRGEDLLGLHRIMGFSDSDSSNDSSDDEDRDL